jgi:uncharacterized protein YndB with AHSA1/START domain
MASGHHRYETYVRATCEQVFAALTDPASTRRHLDAAAHHRTRFPGLVLDHPPVPGEPFRTSFPDGSPAVEGTVETQEAPHRLVLTWHALYDAELAAEPPSRVELELDRAGEDLTRLRLLHTNLAQSPLTWARVEHGWEWFLASVKSLLETGTPLPPPAEESVADPSSDPVGDWHRLQAVEANNSTWELIEKDRRSTEEDEDMLRRAYASTYHWARAARRGPANTARGDWLLSRVHLLLGRAELSLHHADRCLTTCLDHGLTDFDLAYAHEARGRALRALGREDEAAREWEQARSVPIADPEDREALEADLASP